MRSRILAPHSDAQTQWPMSTISARGGTQAGIHARGDSEQTPGGDRTSANPPPPKPKRASVSRREPSGSISHTGTRMKRSAAPPHRSAAIACRASRGACQAAPDHARVRAGRQCAYPAQQTKSRPAVAESRHAGAIGANTTTRPGPRRAVSHTVCRAVC